RAEAETQQPKTKGFTADNYERIPPRGQVELHRTFAAHRNAIQRTPSSSRYSDLVTFILFRWSVMKQSRTQYVGAQPLLSGMWLPCHPCYPYYIHGTPDCVWLSALLGPSARHTVRENASLLPRPHAHAAQEWTQVYPWLLLHPANSPCLRRASIP
ncbi:hypothetical protein JI435_039680, partial [Parastagonospora nodorum SN15]